jgi:TrpR-related protein YerC/YecD
LIEGADCEMNEKLRDGLTDRLFESVLQLKNIDECYMFFEDLCTINEIKSLAQRLEVARMLSEGGTYAGIAAKTGASTATISRVNKYLVYGADGYRMILERSAVLKEKLQKRENKEKIDEIS